MAAGLDMTAGTGWKHVARFSLPLMLGNLLQQLYNTVDGIVVGQFVSDAALAAVGNCASLTFVFLAISFGLANGTGIAISQLFGAKLQADEPEEKRPLNCSLDTPLPVFRLMRGKKAARAAPMLALAASSVCSAWRMSGRRASRSDGRPAGRGAMAGVSARR